MKNSHLNRTLQYIQQFSFLTQIYRLLLDFPDPETFSLTSLTSYFDCFLTHPRPRRIISSSLRNPTPSPRLKIQLPPCLRQRESFMQKQKAIDGDTENLISNSRRDLSQPKKDVSKGIHEST